MRLVSVPAELSLLCLIEFRECPPLKRDVLNTQVRRAIQEGRWEVALDDVQQVLKVAWGQRDAVTTSVSLLLKAEILRRLQRWEEVLDSVREALYWLELQVSQVARYNEAVGVYSEGLVHYTLNAHEKMLATFAYAHDLLVTSERFWGFEQNQTRAADCRNVIRWMARLREIAAEPAPGEVVFLMPVYEVVNEVLIRTDVVAVNPFEITIPNNILARFLPASHVPLTLDALPFLPLDPTASYVAMRLSNDMQVFHQARSGRSGDLLILEVTSPDALQEEPGLSQEQPFVRRSDGHVVFRPQRIPTALSAPPGDSDSPTAASAPPWVGIPRMLIREREEL